MQVVSKGMLSLAPLHGIFEMAKRATMLRFKFQHPFDRIVDELLQRFCVLIPLMNLSTLALLSIVFSSATRFSL